MNISYEFKSLRVVVGNINIILRLLTGQFVSLGNQGFLCLSPIYSVLATCFVSGKKRSKLRVKSLKL